jgi:dienelactone hydrolase
VVVFPQGINNRWDFGSASTDVAFLTQLLDELESQLCLDTNRVYVEGYSLGALMTSRLSCTLADRVAAVSPLAGAYALPDCAPSRPVPMLTFHGTLDTFIPYPPIPGQVAHWATRNGCAGSPTANSVPGDDVVTITKFTYPCPSGTEVEFYSIENGGHSWLGSEFSRSIESVIGYTTFAINATDVMWEFFRHHQVHPDVATYTARFTAAQGTMLARIATVNGKSVADVVRAGVNALRALADSGHAPSAPPQPNDGPYWVTVRWPLGEAGDIDADAAAFGLTGDQLHNAGGRLMNLVVSLAAIGRL